MSIGNVPAALIQKRMLFRMRTASNLIGMVVYSALAVVLALRGAGVFSLISAYLFEEIFTEIHFALLPGFTFQLYVCQHFTLCGVQDTFRAYNFVDQPGT